MTASSKPQAGSSERMAALLETLEIPPFRKDLLRQRWLNQLGWMSRQASRARFRYLLFRIPVVVGGVAIPALITILVSAGDEQEVAWLFGVKTGDVRLVAFGVSMLVAVCATVEETLRFSERWRHYRRTSELLKTLGWQYLMLSGAFRRFGSHAEAFAPFTERVEDVINEDVEGYLGAVAAEDRERPRHEIVA
jgi:hypothetical protein